MEIEILAIKEDLYQTIELACQSLNKVQNEFRFNLPSDRLRSSAFAQQSEEYQPKLLLDWLETHKNNNDSRKFYILVVDGKLFGNLFGSSRARKGVAVFTIHDFDLFLNEVVRYCRYYLVRYAIGFLAPEIKSHNDPKRKDCIFHKKIYKPELIESLNSGKICDVCLALLQLHLNPEIHDAKEKLLKVSSDQYPYAIVLKGGGVKGLAFVGALLVLEKHFLFNAFAGASAGAITAVLLGAGYKPDELEEIIGNKDFNEFRDTSIGGGLWNIITLKKGFYPGNEIENWLKNLISQKIKKEDEVQMSNLKTQTIIYASRIIDGTLQFDTHGKRMETPAYFAARCSMSIPFYFIPPQIDGFTVYDGGLINNFPLSRFIQDHQQKQFIGLYLSSKPNKSRSVILELINLIVDGNEREIVNQNHKKVVVINTDPIGTTDFNLTKEKKEFLLLSGKVAALTFIKENYKDLKVEDNLGELLAELEILRSQIKSPFPIIKFLVISVLILIVVYIFVSILSFLINLICLVRYIWA
jgi:predicted acylesterase/phospholipase RssA